MDGWCWAGLVFRAALGRGGVRRDKQEGDGATPAGLLPLRRVLYRADRVRRAGLCRPGGADRADRRLVRRSDARPITTG